MICSNCNMENPENVEHCENCGEKLTKDDFTKYGIWILALGTLVSAIGFILNKIALSSYMGISFNNIDIMGRLIILAGALILAYRWFNPKKYGN